MQELVQHLCRIIADRLQAQPQMPTADLVTAALSQIAGDEPLRRSIESEVLTIQNISGNATGYQTIVQGGVAYIGDNYHVNEDVARSAIELILKQLGLVPVGIPSNINRYGSDHFVGRNEELLELDKLLRSSRRVAITAIQGMGGIGKTELALQYALGRTHSGGICWLRGREDVGGQIELFALTQLGLSIPEPLKNRDLVDRVKYYWRYWPEGEVLVVVDDVLDFEAIQNYLPPTEARFTVLITTRLDLGGNIQRLDLGVLEAEAALAFLRGLIGAKRVNEEFADSQSLCKWLGYLPLGIELVGNYLKRNETLTVAKMQERLNEKRLAAKGLIKNKKDIGITAAHESLAAAFEVNWDDLMNGSVFTTPTGEYARQLGALLSLFAVAPVVWKWAVDCLPEWDAEDLEAARNEGLLGSHLLQVNGDNTYQLHPLVREFLAVKLDNMSIKDKFQQSCQSVILAAAESSRERPEKSMIKECSLVIPHLQELIDRSADLGDGINEAICANSLAWVHETIGRYKEAEQWYLRALKIREQQFGSDHPNTASSLNNLGNFYETIGRYEESERFLVKALEIREQQLGSDHPDTANSLNNLAWLYETMGKYQEVEELYLRSLATLEQQLGENHLKTSNILHNLGILYESMGRYEESEHLSVRALKIREEQLGSDHPDTASSLSNLGVLYESMERYEESEHLYLRVLAIREQQLEDNHPHTAYSLNNLASLYESTQRYEEAEPLYLKALKIIEYKLGSDHPSTASIVANLANLYRSTGRYIDAEPLYDRALVIREQQLGADHPDTAQCLNDRAKLHQLMYRYSEAEALYLRSLNIMEQQFGVNHTNTQAVRENLEKLQSLMSVQDKHG
jgi:tetratricopeptide (TPR) repeat protein